MREDNFGNAAHCDGAQTETTLTSFDLSLPDVEAYLREPERMGRDCWISRKLVGIELLDKE
jgi:hypothetical protein